MNKLPKPGARVLCAMSGGVDSAVSAFLLKRSGYNVSAAFIKCWTDQDESNCSADRDFEDAQDVCKKLQIPIHQTNLSKQYWTSVFEPFLNDYRQGLTPNPDILCNRYIKFGCFLKQAVMDGVDFIATGHYAQTRYCPTKQGIVLAQPKRH